MSELSDGHSELLVDDRVVVEVRARECLASLREHFEWSIVL